MRASTVHAAAGPTAPAAELFIYYRVKVEHADALQQQVHAMQARLCERHPQLSARLLRRPEPTDGLHTWMETYACHPAHAENGGLPFVAIEAEASALTPLIVGGRHVEIFTACAC